VIDPDNPTRKDTYRRIMIGIVLNPWLITYRLMTDNPFLMACFGCAINRNNFLYFIFSYSHHYVFWPIQANDVNRRIWNKNTSLQLMAHPKQVIITDTTGCNPPKLKKMKCKSFS
jgi:hypothetical protein